MKKAFRFIKLGIHLLIYNFWTLFIFELVYKLVMLSVAGVVLRGGLAFAMHLEGYAYLCDENVAAFAKSPITWIFVLIYIVGWAFFSLFDICCIITCFHASYHEQKIPILNMMKRGMQKAITIVSRGEIFMVVYLLLIVPMTQTIFVSGQAFTFKVPGFIRDYIFSKPLLAIAYVAFWIFMGVKSMQWMYGLHFFALEGCKYKEGRRLSKKLMKDQIGYIQDVISLIVTVVIINLLYIGVVYGLAKLVSVLTVSLADHNAVCSMLLSLLSLGTLTWWLFGYALSLPSMYLVISVKFYMRKRRRKMPIPPAFDDFEDAIHLTKTRWARWMIRYRKRIVAIAFCAFFSIYFIYNLADRNGLVFLNQAEDVQVCAHRGDTEDYPENSLPAFQSAILNGADMIELDVQQTKDRKLVISHDSNVRRTTGVNKNIYDMTYLEILELDIGYLYGEEFANTPMPTLDQVLNMADGKCRVLIEIKATEYDQDIEEQVIETIKKHNMVDDVVVCSLEYEVIQNVKKIDDSIETAYISSVTFGNFNVLESADGYSVEENMLTAKFVRRAHKAGKTVYVWTLNREAEITDSIDKGADVLITDDPFLAKTIVEDKQNASAWDNLFDNILDTVQSN